MISLDTLTEQVKEVLAFSQGWDKSKFGHVDKLITQWWENKKRFYEVLGEDLIWEGPYITLDYTQDIKEAMFYQFIEESVRFLDLHDGGSEIDDWEYWIKQNASGFFTNTVVNPLPETDMKQGMKLIRAFKFFDFEEYMIRHIQDLASQVIQKNKIEGQLCISIHPLDYLSISDNRANWRSCHALNGEFRAGNLSYMLDKTTLVCYIKSKEYVQLERFPDGMMWNNKKWRVLLHIHPASNIAYVNRQYPFSSDEIMFELSHSRPMEDMGFDNFATYTKDKGFREVNGHTLSQNYFMIHGYIVDPTDMCAGDKKAMQYNDFIFSPHYTPQYIIPRQKWWWSGTHEAVKHDFAVPIGVRVPCPCCGKNYLDDSCSFMCEDC